MALSGSLSDMNINDVLQLPAMGRQAGELKLDHNGQTARFYYNEGRIVHGVLGAKRDEDALVDALGWTTGDFTFTQGIAAPKKTIEEDLHRLLMRVAKKRDEQRKPAPAPASPGLRLESEEAKKGLQEAMGTHAGFVLLSFVTRDGRCPNAVPADSSLKPVSQSLAKHCFSVADAAPRTGIKRCWLEYDDGHTLWLRLGTEVSLVMMAQPSVPMGAMMLAASKVGVSLKQLIDGEVK
ncbi:MAG: DUF4388 domain-containing protein [Deltaproteobacteria bacterium]|nr:DUF4388 domain-containing protein [Deltaproteobacteria bacterium]